MDLTIFEPLGLSGEKALGALLIICGAASYGVSDLSSSIAISLKRHNQTPWIVRLASVAAGAIVACVLVGLSPLALIIGAIAGAFNIQAMRIGSALVRKGAPSEAWQSRALPLLIQRIDGAAIVVNNGAISEAGGALLAELGIDASAIKGQPASGALGAKLAQEVANASGSGFSRTAHFYANGRALLALVHPLGAEGAPVIVTLEPPRLAPAPSAAEPANTTANILQARRSNGA